MDEHQNVTDLNRLPDEEEDAVNRVPNDTNFESSHPLTGDGASPGKIFIGGLARDTTSAQFTKHFGKYGEITDSVIMKDRNTGQPRGFGFITFADASVVDRVIEDTHVFHGKQVEIKRTIPRGANSKDFKTKKIFVGGIPATVDEDEFRNFFSSFGEVKEQQIMKDHSTGRSRGFGFVTFESEQSVDNLLANGNRLDFAGTQVEIKKAEPKKPNILPPPSRRPTSSRYAPDREFGDGYGGFGVGPYRSGGPYGGRAGGYGGYGGGEFGGYGGYSPGGYGGLRADPSLGYSRRFGGGFGGGYDLGGEYGGPGDSYAGYGGGGFGGGGYGGGGYDGGFGGGGYGGGGGGPAYGGRGGYGGGGGGGRYHPYGR